MAHNGMSRAGGADMDMIQAMKETRKSLAHQTALDRAMETKKTVAELRELSAEDQKLAELGYRQVKAALEPPFKQHAEVLPGLQARVLMDVMHLFRSLNLRLLRKRGYKLYLPPVCWWRRIRCMVLAHFWSWMHVHCFVSLRDCLCIPNIRRCVFCM